jgi:hypothetical protein
MGEGAGGVDSDEGTNTLLTFEEKNTFENFRIREKTTMGSLSGIWIRTDFKYECAAAKLRKKILSGADPDPTLVNNVFLPEPVLKREKNKVFSYYKKNNGYENDN